MVIRALIVGVLVRPVRSLSNCTMFVKHSDWKHIYFLFYFLFKLFFFILKVDPPFVALFLDPMKFFRIFTSHCTLRLKLLKSEKQKGREGKSNRCLINMSVSVTVILYSLRPPNNANRYIHVLFRVDVYKYRSKSRWMESEILYTESPQQAEGCQVMPYTRGPV